MSPPPIHRSPIEWNQLVASFPETHVLQSWEWGQSKIRNGWQPVYLVWKQGGQREVTRLRWEVGKPSASGAANSITAGDEDIRAAAMILQRTISIGGFAARLRVLYAPKGPLLRDWGDTVLRQTVLADLQDFARQHGAIFLKIDPDVRLGSGVPGEAQEQTHIVGQNLKQDLKSTGWVFSSDQVQFRNTVMVDLSPDEEQLLARMKQKTRYNIRLAQRKGVTVRCATAAELGLLYRMYAETAARDTFTIRDEAYYLHLWNMFLRSPQSAASPREFNFAHPVAEPLIAEVEGEPAAAIVVFQFASKAWYLFGMSRQAHREKMPNYLLQWEAMRRAKAAGCTMYDLWGAPDEFDESDSMWGVWRFKEGLGGEVVRHIGAWDYPASRLLYPMYTRILPRLLDVLRSRSAARTRRQAGA